MRSLFIDTDAGTDDAVALIMAMQFPEVCIRGISTCGGNVSVEKVVQNVLYIRDLCNYQVPVYEGAATPLNRPLAHSDFIHGKDGMGDIGLDLTGRMPDTGVGFQKIIEAIDQYPDQIELIALGPLTNLALAEMNKKGLLKKARKLIVMGGLVDLPGNITPLAEFNIWADPEAAKIVLGSGARISMIGWDTTLRCSNFSLAELAEIKSTDTELAHLVADIQQCRMNWMRDNNLKVTVNLADALAMAVALQDSLVLRRSTVQMKVDDGIISAAQRGFIQVKYEVGMTDIDYVHSVHRAAYFDLLKASLG